MTICLTKDNYLLKFIGLAYRVNTNINTKQYFGHSVFVDIVYKVVIISFFKSCLWLKNTHILWQFNISILTCCVKGWIPSELWYCFCVIYRLLCMELCVSNKLLSLKPLPKYIIMLNGTNKWIHICSANCGFLYLVNLYKLWVNSSRQ